MATVERTVKAGTRVRTDATFTTEGTTTPTDPTTVKLRVRQPGSVITTYAYGTDSEIVRDDTGDYHALIICSSPGTWWFSWVGESAVGGVNAVADLAVRVEKSATVDA